TRDSHPLDVRHAWRTNEKSPTPFQESGFFVYWFFFSEVNFTLPVLLYDNHSSCRCVIATFQGVV
ncbi:MAG: hypothetical protein AAFO07_28655, partial [Bacteroidota bacterium]